MPDGDVFERKLFGKGWKRAYRAASGKIDFNDLVSVLNNAKDEALRNGLSCPRMDDISSLIYEALNQPLFNSIDIYRQLSLKLDALATSQTSFPGTRIAIDAAKRLYAELSYGKKPIAKEEVRRILDKEFFSKVRESLMEKSGRNRAEEIDWEKRLTDSVLSYKRTSARWLSSQGWGVARLNEPLQILGGEND
jgi:hypothetical protein